MTLERFDAVACILIKNMAILRFAAMIGAMVVITCFRGIEIWTLLHHLSAKSDNRQQQILNIINQGLIWDSLLLLLGMAALTLQKLSFKAFGSEAQVSGDDRTDNRT